MPIPAGPMTETSRARCSRSVAWNRSLSSRSSAARPTNGASSVSLRFRPRCPATTRAARHAGTGAALPLSTCRRRARTRSTRWPRGGSPRRPAPARRRDRLEPGGGVDEVARDHALVGGPDGHRGLTGEDAGPRLDPGPRRGHGLDELEGRPDGALGVVLEGDRRAPDRHHRVADELLDRAAVAADHLAREVEVAAERVPDVLGVAFLGEGREPDEVGEQDRHEPSLGDRTGAAVAGRPPRRKPPARCHSRRRSGRWDGSLPRRPGRRRAGASRTRHRTSCRPRSRSHSSSSARASSSQGVAEGRQRTLCARPSHACPAVASLAASSASNRAPAGPADWPSAARTTNCASWCSGSAG